MTTLYDLYATDKALETEGFWHNVTDKIRFRLARAGGSNMKFAKVLEKKTRPHRRASDPNMEDMDIELANNLLVEAFAETVVLGWEGVTDSKGKKVPYSINACVKILRDLPDLFTELREAAARQANFRVSEIKDDAEN